MAATSHPIARLVAVTNVPVRPIFYAVCALGVKSLKKGWNGKTMNPQYNETVRAHLRELFASRAFAGSPRLRQFLSYVVEKTLIGQGGEIKEFLIASEVYGRGPEYDPQVDSTVRVEASRLRGKLRSFYANAPLGMPVRIEMPKGSYVPLFQVAETAGLVEPAA